MDPNQKADKPVFEVLREVRRSVKSKDMKDQQMRRAQRSRSREQSVRVKDESSSEERIIKQSSMAEGEEDEEEEEEQPDAQQQSMGQSRSSTFADGKTPRAELINTDLTADSPLEELKQSPSYILFALVLANLDLGDKEGFARAFCNYTDFFYRDCYKDTPVIGWGSAGAPNLNNHSLWESKAPLRGKSLRRRYRICQKKMSQLMKIRPNTVNGVKQSIQAKHYSTIDKEKLNRHDDLVQTLNVVDKNCQYAVSTLQHVKQEYDTVIDDKNLLMGHNRRLRTQLKQTEKNHELVCQTKDRIIFNTQDEAYLLQNQNIQQSMQIEQQSDALSSLQSANVELQNAKLQFENQVMQLEQFAAEQKAQVAVLTVQLQESKRQIEHLSGIQSRLEIDLAEKGDETEDLTRQIQVLNDMLRTAIEDNEGLKNLLGHANAQLNDLEIQNDLLQEDIDEMNEIHLHNDELLAIHMKNENPGKVVLRDLMRVILKRNKELAESQLMTIVHESMDQIKHVLPKVFSDLRREDLKEGIKQGLMYFKNTLTDGHFTVYELNKINPKVMSSLDDLHLILNCEANGVINWNKFLKQTLDAYMVLFRAADFDKDAYKTMRRRSMIQDIMRFLEILFEAKKKIDGKETPQKPLTGPTDATENQNTMEAEESSLNQTKE